MDNVFTYSDFSLIWEMFQVLHSLHLQAVLDVGVVPNSQVEVQVVADDARQVKWWHLLEIENLNNYYRKRFMQYKNHIRV